MYKVRIERKAQKKLAKIPPPFYAKIKAQIIGLAENPRPAGSKKLINRNGYRIRIGNYRVIYEVFDEILLVQVIELGHRKDIYR